MDYESCLTGLSLTHQASSETGNVSKVEMPLLVIVSIAAFSRDMAAKVYSIKLSSILIFSTTLLREENGNPLQYSCLENPMDRGAWQAAVYRVAKSRTRPSDFTFAFHFHALEKEMATHSSNHAWIVPGMEEPRGLPSMGLHRVGHN